MGRRHVVTLMRRMGIEVIYRRPRTSIPAREAAIHPYLLGNLAIDRPNQVWAADITYLPMAHGFLYLVAILDVASRKVLAFRLSNTLTADFCVEALEEALAKFGAPEIFNTDQGSQFTSEEWIKVLDDAGVAISMDGKGRWIDNVFIERLWRSVKYEEVYLHGYANGTEARASLDRVLQLLQRPPLSSSPRVPNAGRGVFRSARGRDTDGGLIHEPAPGIPGASAACGGRPRCWCTIVCVRGTHPSVGRLLLPAMRQQFLKAAGGLRRQALHDVLEVDVRIMPVELGGLDQAHDRRGALTGPQ